MRRPPQLPDLGKLTDTQKDALIVSLWETLTAIEETGGASGAAVASLRRMICVSASGRLRPPTAHKHAWKIPPASAAASIFSNPRFCW